MINNTTGKYYSLPFIWTETSAPLKRTRFTQSQKFELLLSTISVGKNGHVLAL